MEIELFIIFIFRKTIYNNPMLSLEVKTMQRQHRREKTGHFLWRFAVMTIGATLAAIALELFLVENNIIDGGIIGIALLLNHITAINFGILVFFLNIPFLLFGYKYIGKSFFISSIFSIFILAIIEPNLQRRQLQKKRV